MNVEAALAIVEEGAFAPNVFATSMQKAGVQLGFPHFFLFGLGAEKPKYIAAAEAEDHLAAYLRDGWWSVDDRTDYTSRVSDGVVMSDEVEVPERVRAGSTIYNDFYRPRGISWNAGWKMRIGGEVWGLSLLRAERDEPPNKVELAKLTAIAPRISNAVELAHAVGQRYAQGLMEGFASVGAAALLLDHDGRVMMANAEAETLFGTDFNVLNGYLHARDPVGQRHLERLAQVTRSTPIDDTLSNFAIQRYDGRKPIVAKPVRIRGAGLDALPGARTAVLLSDLDAPSNVHQRSLQKLFGLTLAEADVALLLAKGWSVRDISTFRKVKPDTVRGQLKAVFAKLDVVRQSDVVRVVERLARR